MDGQFLANGTDLVEVFRNSTCERMFNIIDSVVIDDIVRDGSLSSEVSKKRAEVNKIYGRIMSEDSSNDEYYGPNEPENATPHTYNDGLDEAGIPGMPPLG